LARQSQSNSETNQSKGTRMTKDEIMHLRLEANTFARAHIQDLREVSVFDHIRDARLIQLVEEKVRLEYKPGWRKRQINLQKEIED